MMQQISSGHYLEAICLAEKFILHVEVLFATIDDLEAAFAQQNAKGVLYPQLLLMRWSCKLTSTCIVSVSSGMTHIREARILCRKMVELLTLLPSTREGKPQSGGNTSENILSLITSLAHHLKILIRITLTGSIKLKNEFGDNAALDSCLEKLHRLSLEGANPLTKRLISDAAQIDTVPDHVARVNDGTQGVIFGYKSLAPENAGDSPFQHGGDLVKTPSDLCIGCNTTVEEDCIRLGTYLRWHAYCVKCKVPGCNRAAGTEAKRRYSTQPPAPADEFLFEPKGWKSVGSPPLTDKATVSAIFCLSHAHAQCRSGFQAVSRLEQYVFLLNVALRRLYLLLKQQGVVRATSLPTRSALRRFFAPTARSAVSATVSSQSSGSSATVVPQRAPEDQAHTLPAAAYSQTGRLIGASPVDNAIRMWEAKVKSSGSFLDDGISVVNVSGRGSPPVESEDNPAPLFEDADDDSGPTLHRSFSMLTFDSVTVFDGEDPIHVATKDAFYGDDDRASIRTYNSLLF